MNAKALLFTPVVLAVAWCACSSNSDQKYDELRRAAIDRQNGYAPQPAAPSTGTWTSLVPDAGTPINTVTGGPPIITGTGGSGGALDGGKGGTGGSGGTGGIGITGGFGGTGGIGITGGSGGSGGTGGIGGTGGSGGSGGTGGTTVDAGLPSALELALSSYVSFSPFASGTVATTSDPNATVTSTMTAPAVLRTTGATAYLTFDYDATSGMVSYFAVKFGSSTTPKRISNSLVGYSGTASIGMYTSGTSVCLTQPPGCQSFTVNVAAVTAYGASAYVPMQGVLICGNSCQNPGCDTLDPNCVVPDGG